MRKLSASYDVCSTAVEHPSLLWRIDALLAFPNNAARCVRLAAARSPQLATTLQEALQKHELARVQARVRRHTGTAAAAAAAAGLGTLPGKGAAAGGASRAAAAAAAAVAAAAAGVGGIDPRNVTVLADAEEADDKLQGLLAGGQPLGGVARLWL